MENKNIDLSSLLKRIEILEKNNSLEVVAGNIYTKINNLKKEINDHINLIDKTVSTIEGFIKDSKEKDKTDYDNIVKKLDELVTKVKSTKVRKDDMLKSLQENGDIDLRYNLVLTPRVLPNKAKNGTLIIDVKDNKLKFYNNGWITVNNS